MVTYHTMDVGNARVFWREAGSKDRPAFLLLHGFPSSSAMFRNLMPLLEDDFHLIAPDMPGFGRTEAPGRDAFSYTFEHLTDVIDGFLDALGVKTFHLYVFDYGAPVGFRLAMRHPERIFGIVSQNGNVYREGLGPKWAARAEYWAHPTPEAREGYKSAFAPQTVYGQYTTGEAEGIVGPDGYGLDLYYAATKPDYAEIQSDLILDYQTNVALYPAFQAYLREHQPKLLAAWGKNDPSFVWPGAEAFARDVTEARIVPLDGGHFALEAHYEEMARLIRETFA